HHIKSRPHCAAPRPLPHALPILAALEAFLPALERAVEIPDEDHAPAGEIAIERSLVRGHLPAREQDHVRLGRFVFFLVAFSVPGDRKSTRLNSSHVKISYAVFCL